MNDPTWRLPDKPKSYIIDRRRRSIDRAHLDVVPIRSITECVISEHLTIWVGEFQEGQPVPKAFAVDGREFRRLLDHFHIPAVPDTALSVALFDLCAERYERLVDVPRNIANIHNLLQVVLGARQEKAGPVNMLDFGCGTGLVVRALQSFMPRSKCIIHCTGTDRAPHMLEMAGRRGLVVLRKEDWERVPAEAYDAVIASYVAHLGISRADCELIAKQLGPGGVFAANYHRGDDVGMAELESLLNSIGLCALPLPACDAGTSGNPTILFGKPRI